MSTLFPGGYDAYTNPAAGDALDSVTVPHATQHADLNDAMEAVQRYLRRVPFYPPFTPTGNDDEFDDASFSGWTAVQDASPVLTLTESNDCLSVLHPGGDSAAELHAWVKAQSFAANDWVETCIRFMGRHQSFPIFGLLFSDGTTYGAGNQVTFDYNVADGNFALRVFTGFNANTSTPAFAGVSNYLLTGEMFLRLKYLGSNQWKAFVSADGISWIDYLGTVNATLTPTHAGFFVSTWGGASAANYSFRYVRFGNG